MTEQRNDHIGPLQISPGQNDTRSPLLHHKQDLQYQSQVTKTYNFDNFDQENNIYLHIIGGKYIFAWSPIS